MYTYIYVYTYIYIGVYIYALRIACMRAFATANRRNSFSHVIALGIHPRFAQDVIRHTINRPSKNRPPEFLKIALF